jgi:hypothetical protein
VDIRVFRQLSFFEKTLKKIYPVSAEVVEHWKHLVFQEYPFRRVEVL